MIRPEHALWDAPEGCNSTGKFCSCLQVHVLHLHMNLRDQQVTYLCRGHDLECFSGPISGRDNNECQNCFNTVEPP